MALTKVPSNLDATIATTQSASDNSTNVATTAYVTTAIANLVDGAPSTLNTLDEIAAALNDDAALNTTLTNSIALKAPLANPDFTGQLQVTNSATTIQELIVTGNNTRSALSLQSKDPSGGTVDLRMHSLGDGPRGEIFTFSNHDLAFATNNGAPQMTLDTGGRLGIKQTPATNNFTLQVKGMQTNGTDGRVAYFKGYGTQTSIGSTGPSVVIQNANNTTNNYTKLSFESAGAGETVSINSQNIDHTNHYGDMAFNTRGSGGYYEKARIKANGHLEFNPVNSFAALNNSILSSSNTYMYMMGGAAGLYLANNSGLDTSIGIRDANYIDFNTSSGEKMRLTSAGILDIGKASFSSYPAGSKLNVYADGEGIRLDGTGGTTRRLRFRNVGAGTGPGEIVADGSLIIKNEDANAYLNLSSIRNIEYQVTSGNGTAGHHIFNSYNTEIMRLDGASNNAKFTYPILQGGSTSSVGIGSTMADVNGAELGPGYLNLARDDTVDAKQISFSKNGVRVSDISTTDKGILWEVLESSGNAAAFQVTNGVGQTVWGSMNAQGHKWQDNVYNAFSAGGMSMGSDSSNTSHMWWNVYDTGSKHGVSAGYGMDEYVSNSTGDYTIRMSDSSGFVGDGVVLTERYRFTNKGSLNIYATGSQNETNDAKIYVVKNSSSDWSMSLISGADDYGIRVRGNGAYAFGCIDHNANSYRARIHYSGYIYSSDGTIHDIDSDVRLKEEIVAAPSQWQMIKDLPLQKYKWKDRRHGDIDSYGWIAQEVEKKYPEFVEPIPQTKEAADAGEQDPEYLTVKTGDITRRALAALQEAMARIETLEAEVAALKG